MSGECGGQWNKKLIMSLACPFTYLCTDHLKVFLLAIKVLWCTILYKIHDWYIVKQNFRSSRNRSTLHKIYTTAAIETIQQSNRTKQKETQNLVFSFPSLLGLWNMQLKLITLYTYTNFHCVHFSQKCILQVYFKFI